MLAAGTGWRNGERVQKMTTKDSLKCGTRGHDGDRCLACVVVSCDVLVTMLEKVGEISARFGEDGDVAVRTGGIGCCTVIAGNFADRLMALLEFAQAQSGLGYHWQIYHHGNLVLDRVDAAVPFLEAMKRRQVESYSEPARVGVGDQKMVNWCGIYSLALLVGAARMVRMSRVEFLDEMSSQFIRGAGELAFKGFIAREEMRGVGSDAGWLDAEYESLLGKHDEGLRGLVCEDARPEDRGVLIGLGLPSLLMS